MYSELGAELKITEASIVGPICESSDIFAKERVVDRVQTDDLGIFRTAGAYGAVMASAYNTRPLVPEIMVNEGDFAVVRDRITVDDMLAREALPGWLAEGKEARREAGE